MELKNIFKMTKADRYTQDGRDQIAKLQETEDVTYKTGDISQKTGLQKQPDGSWAPPKGSSAAKHQKAMEGAKKVGIVNKVPSGWKKAEGVTTTPNGYVAITNGGSRFPKEGQAKRNVKFIKQEDFEKSAATENPYEVTEEFKQKAMENPETRLSQKYEAVIKAKGTPNYEKALAEYSKEREAYKNTQGAEAVKKFPITPAENEPAAEGLESKSTEELTNLFNELATKSVREKSPENSAARDRVYKELKRRQKAESNPTDKYKDLPGAQKKDALFASTFEGISIGQTQNQMERQGWELISTGEETGENVNVYAKPDGSKVTMKHDGQKITSSEYEAPAENPDYPFKPKTSEERAERAKFEKDRDDFIERMNAYREESKQWTNRAKGERTATLVDWLDDWDKHPEEKNDAAYAAIEKELASRGVNRAGRQDAKKADNAGRNEFYRRAYESDAAPKIRQLTGDCKIRIRK